MSRVSSCASCGARTVWDGRIPPRGWSDVTLYALPIRHWFLCPYCVRGLQVLLDHQSCKGEEQ